jgi:hypothetical protein
LVDSGGNYIPVALGSAVDYNGPTSFISTPFGGSDTFILSSTTTVYGGLYWDAGPDAPYISQASMPIGFEDSTGDSYIFYGSLAVVGPDTYTYLPGANPPVIGTAVSSQTSSDEGEFSRAYNFSIDIGAAAVPLPNSVLGGAALLALLGGSRRCRRVLT